MGLENCDQFFVEKIVEVQVITSKVEEEAMKGAKEALKETLGTSEAYASGSVPKVAISEAVVSEAVASEAADSEAAVSEATQSAKVYQIPNPQTTISPSSSTDSNLYNIPLSQKYKLSKPSPKSKRTPKSKTSSKPKLSPKTKSFKPVYPEILKSIGELSQRRIDICNRLPADHPFQPPIIKPLNMIPAGETIPSSSLSNQSPTRESPKVVGSTTAAEEHADPEEPSTADLPHSDSPTNKQQQQTTSSPHNQTFEQHVISNLESHYSGELLEYQKQKASENPPQTTTTKTLEKTIPESVMETVVEESVQVIESEPSVSISNFEPTQNLKPGASEQPSFSSQIQILDQPPVNILESEYLEDQLVEIHEEMQTLVLL